MWKNSNQTHALHRGESYGTTAKITKSILRYFIWLQEKKVRQITNDSLFGFCSFRSSTWMPSDVFRFSFFYGDRNIWFQILYYHETFNMTFQTACVNFSLVPWFIYVLGTFEWWRKCFLVLFLYMDAIYIHKMEKNYLLIIVNILLGRDIYQELYLLFPYSVY